MMNIEFIFPRLSLREESPLLRLQATSLSGILVMALVALNLSACAPKKVEAPFPPPKDPFDYSRLDLEGLVEFTNRFGMLPDSARLAICREMELSDKEKKNDSRGLTLHQAAGQIFLANCSPSPELQEKLNALLENPETSTDQRQFANLVRQLITRQESQNNALIQAQKKARSKSNGNGSRRKSEGTEREAPPQEDPSKIPLPSPPPEDVARKKLEAIRNLEKSMDRGLTP